VHHGDLVFDVAVFNVQGAAVPANFRIGGRIQEFEQLVPLFGNAFIILAAEDDQVGTLKYILVLFFPDAR
jgi:hypothetical protein